jgi:hypothetical protein
MAAAASERAYLVVAGIGVELKALARAVSDGRS